MSNAREQAKALLVHYFDLATEFKLIGDTRPEIESIVDCIIDAAVHECSKTITEVIKQMEGEDGENEH